MTQSLIKLQGFLQLKKGWCYGEGGPIPGNNIVSAAQFVHEAMKYGLGELDVFPGLNDEVSVSIYDGRDHLEFILEHNGTVTFLHEHNGEEVVYREALTLNEATSEIRRYKEKKKPCVMSEYSTKFISTKDYNVSQALLSTPLATARSQSLGKDVQKRSAVLSANISLAITRLLPGPQLCTGS
jgi:hypothetical protein